METTAPSTAQFSALLRLLDDPSPSVRRALLARFTALGAEAAPFLRDLSHGPDRGLAAHAA